MFYKAMGVLAVMSLAACSTNSSSTTSPSAAPTAPTGGSSGGATGGGSTGGGTTGGGTTPTPMPGITATNGAASAITQGTPGGDFVRAAGSSPLGLVQTNQATRSHWATYDLTVNGVTYNLAPAPGNSFGNPNNFHTASNGGEQVSVFLNEDLAGATIVNTQVTDASGATTQYFAVLGTLTDAASLPASASYSGIGEISIDNAKGAFDDAPATTVTMDVDFSAGTLSGQFDVSDPAGENGGNFDISGTAVLPVTGTVTGAEFVANVDYSGLASITSGVSSISAQPVTGGFFGAAADEAVGVGLSTGSSGATDDVMVYTRIQATKQ